jgi:hypothetical protein
MGNVNANANANYKHKHKNKNKNKNEKPVNGREFATSAEDDFLENQEKSSNRAFKTSQVSITRAIVA